MADREPEDLRLETTSQRRDTITFVVPTQVRNDEGVFVRQDIDRVYELKLGIELSLGDFTEIERCMKRLDALPPPTEAGKRLAALRSVIHRMVSTAIIDPVPTDVLDSLNIDKWRNSDVFYSEDPAERQWTSRRKWKRRRHSPPRHRLGPHHSPAPAFLSDRLANGVARYASSNPLHSYA